MKNWLCWPVRDYGQITRYIQAPNHPTAQTMLAKNERLAAEAGKQRFKVPLWFRENAITVYE